MASADCDITFEFNPGTARFFSDRPDRKTYDEVLDEALDTVKAAIKEAPKGAYFGVEKTAEGSTLGDEPVIRFTCHFDLPHKGT